VILFPFLSFLLEGKSDEIPHFETIKKNYVATEYVNHKNLANTSLEFTFKGYVFKEEKIVYEIRMRTLLHDKILLEVHCFCVVKNM